MSARSRPFGGGRAERRAVAAGAQASAKPVGRLVGERIAALRLDKRLTLDALAAGTGLTTSFLSKLERGRTSISVDNLRSISHFLGVEMVHFFEQTAPSSAVVIRKGEGTPLTIANTDAFGRSLITTTRSTLQATLYSTPPGQGRSVGFSHRGEEFVFLIRRRLLYAVGGAEYRLDAGDSLWHRSTEPHRWSCLGRTTALSLHVNTPPVW
jgi:transcriptional regulator with XRE-family HTH domain